MENNFEKYLEEALNILKTHNKPKPYKLTLNIVFYNDLGKEYWIDYHKRHRDVIITFTDKNHYYSLNPSGELTIDDKIFL